MRVSSVRFYSVGIRALTMNASRERWVGNAPHWLGGAREARVDLDDYVFSMEKKRTIEQSIRAAKRMGSHRIRAHLVMWNAGSKVYGMKSS